MRILVDLKERLIESCGRRRRKWWSTEWADEGFRL
jgi:hypothetical protein